MHERAQGHTTETLQRLKAYDVQTYAVAGDLERTKNVEAIIKLRCVVVQSQRGVLMPSLYHRLPLAAGDAERRKAISRLSSDSP